MSENLSVAYEGIRGAKKAPFDIEAITDALMAEPLKLDISEIIHTPLTVIVKKKKDEYMNCRIASEIRGRFNADAICKGDMLVFSESQ